MGYAIDGAFLAACIGAYRVYTDRRKSVMSSSWDNYRLFWLNLGRHAGDFMASSFFDAATNYPTTFTSLLTKSNELLPGANAWIEAKHQKLLLRASRYRIWSQYSHLGYLQRVVRLGSSEDSLFGPCRSWRNNLTYTSPHLLNYVKDSDTRDYLETLCSVRDSHSGILEGSPAEIMSLLAKTKQYKKDLLQDIRKGHILDRKSESSVSIIHELRMEIEALLFGVSGPDPERSSYIDKCLKDESKGLGERLFPFVEVIVDTRGETLEGSTLTELKNVAPNIDVFVPYLRLGNKIVAVGLGNRQFVICPLNSQLEFEGTLEEGSRAKITHREFPTEFIAGTVVGRYGKAIKIVI